MLQCAPVNNGIVLLPQLEWERSIQVVDDVCALIIGVVESIERVRAKNGVKKSINKMVCHNG